MKKLPKPYDQHGVEFVAQDVFALCISRIRKAELKLRLADKQGRVSKAAAKYDTAAAAALLHTLVRQSSVGNVTKDEMISVYTSRMVKQPGRPVYDRIILAPKNQKCPLCGIGTVNTLDHHLPKTEYPILAVVPNNLIPSCEWCQGEKGTTYPTSAGEQTIHPYFDDFDSEIWLRAEVVHSIPASFRFFVQTPANWDAVICQRLNSHLDTFNLRVLYSANAGGELSGIRGRLNRLFNAGGSEEVRNHLREEALSWTEDSNNSWKAAMYTAAADSDWFCGGGFAPE